jgi:glycosyltransferase involved in cell wall biosynthesis
LLQASQLETVNNISVIICTHNPRPDYLQRVLDALKAQALPKEQWELLLIDNANSEPLAEIWDLSWHPRARHVRESELGLTHARLRGIKESNGELLVFVDDDNVLQFDYLSESIRISAAWPVLGAWGGQQFPEFESGEPAEAWKREFWTGKLDRDLWSNNYDRKIAPCGSGVCVRQVIARRYAELAQADTLRLNLDRRGAGLNSAGDIDMDFTACDLGLGMGRFRTLCLTHLIPAKRLTDDYLYNLCEGFGYSDTVLNALRGKWPQSPCRIDRLVAAYKRFRVGGAGTLQNVARDEGRKRAILFLEKYAAVHALKERQRLA